MPSKMQVILDNWRTWTLKRIFQDLSKEIAVLEISGKFKDNVRGGVPFVKVAGSEDVLKTLTKTRLDYRLDSGNSRNFQNNFLNICP